MIVCKSCGHQTDDAYDDTEWCTTCVGSTLKQQARDRYAPQRREIINPGPSERVD
jgi:predicted metal-binding protein